MTPSNGWEGDAFYVGGRVWAKTREGVPFRCGRVVDLLATDPALPAETLAELDARACAAVEAAADAEIDALLAARGWRYVVCRTCNGRRLVEGTAGAPLGYAALVPCPDCTGGVRRVRT